jgi:hypothetical protein
MDKRCRFGRPQIQLPIFAASTAARSPANSHAKNAKACGWYSPSYRPFFPTSQLIAKAAPSAFSQLLLLQILSPIVKKICKIEK